MARKRTGVKNPDFVHESLPIAIEVFWERHKNQFREGGMAGWVESRSALFNACGWKIVFVEAKQLTTVGVQSLLTQAGV